MTMQEIESKIKELDQWLTENPTNTYLNQVLEMKRDYENQLKLLENG
jgi:hypothetical protein